ncbi:MAG: hypothetical protein WCS18_12655 [Sphaerochaetaceae bacterium]
MSTAKKEVMVSTAQSFSDAEKTQGRTNIGAASSDGLASTNYAVAQITSALQGKQNAPSQGSFETALETDNTISIGTGFTAVVRANSTQAGQITFTKATCTSADIFSESRTYGNTVKEAAVSLASGHTVVCFGNGDFNSTPSRITMDIYDNTNRVYYELRFIVYTVGSLLHFDWIARS